jgi:hypothetical protein
LGPAFRQAVKRREPSDDLRGCLATVNGVAGIGDFRLVNCQLRQPQNNPSAVGVSVRTDGRRPKVIRVGALAVPEWAA